MGIKKKLALLGAVAVTAISPMKSQASVDNKDLKTVNLKQELVLNKNVEISVKQESKSLVDSIKRGEKVTHGSIVFDVPKLKQLQSNGELKDFEIVFEGEKVGLKFHDDGKRGMFSKDKEAKSYMILMPRQNFEGFLAAMLRKEIKTEVKERSDNPNEWVFEDNYPDFFVIDKDGNRKTMTDKEDASRMLTKLTDTFCKWNSEEVVNVGDIVKGYELEIKQFGGWIGGVALDLIGSSSWAQNRLIQNVIKPWFEKDFRDLALNSAKKRDNALKAFNEEKAKAIKKYNEDRDPEIIAKREQERIDNLLSFNKIDGVSRVENRDNQSSLTFMCGDKRVFISTQQGKLTNQSINYFKDNLSIWKYEIQPEEWEQIIPLLEKGLSDEQKTTLGDDFFKTIQKYTFVQVADNSSKLNPTVVAALKGNVK